MELEWLADVRPCDVLVALRDGVPLYPQSLWNARSDADEAQTIFFRRLRGEDRCLVLDVLEEDGRAYTALLATPIGVGCVMLLSAHFELARGG